MGVKLWVRRGQIYRKKGEVWVCERKDEGGEGRRVTVLHVWVSGKGVRETRTKRERRQLKGGYEGKEEEEEGRGV